MPSAGSAVIAAVAAIENLHYTELAGLRCRIGPWAYPLELLLNPLPWTLLLLITDFASLATPLIAVTLGLEVSAARLLRGTPLAPRHAAIIPLKDLGYFAGWFASFAVRTVSWRGRTYPIRAGGRLEPTVRPAPQTADIGLPGRAAA